MEAKLSFLYAALRVDLRYNPLSIIKIFQMVTEIQAKNEFKVWTRGNNWNIKISRVVILGHDNPH